MGKYDDIINLPHHVSSVHPQMSREARAAQFAPFAALSGYGDSIEETGRVTYEKPELDEQHKEALDAAFSRILSEPDRKLRILYFRPDFLKDGGEYVSIEGTFKKIDDTERKLILDDGTKLPIEDIYSITFCD